ncbi:LysR family transcriptional regulator [Bdellovibrio sp. HCB2-146]|uniref:LysR family transcriptional regulator n=1 Tax=Bdellovibrio sp. HCB2-146 TaxID=3394362 RepID=UPI0039BC3354
MTLPNLDHLKYFADAVELGSISAAAQKNFVTHPAISRAITSLEEQMGVELLVHQRKNFQVTPTGYQVAEQARVLLASAREFTSLKLQTEDLSGAISIGLSRTLGHAYLSPLLQDLAKKYPKMKAHIRFGTTNEIIEGVVKGNIDIGLTIGHQTMPTLKQNQIGSGKFVLIESESKKPSPWEERDYILTEPRYETELLKKEFYREFKEPLPARYEVGSWDAIVHLVRSGQGVGLVPEIAITPDRTKQLRILKPKWFQCDYEIFLHHAKGSRPNPAVESLIKGLI